MQLERGSACLGITVKRLFLFCCCTLKDVFLVLHNRSHKVWLFDNRTKNKSVSAQWLHLSASAEDLMAEDASWIIPPPNWTIKTGRRIIKRGGWRAVKTFWSRDGVLVLAAAGVVWNRGRGGGVTNASKSILSSGRSVFFDLHGKDLQHFLGEERTRLPWRGWAWILWRERTTTRSWASPWGLVPEEREEDSRSPGRKNFLGCAGPRITREIITQTVIIKSTICSPRVTFGLSRLAPLDRLGCGWPRPAESPLLCLFNAGPAWEWYKHLKQCVLHLYLILSKHLHGRRSSLIPRSLCLSACYYCGAPEIRMCLTSSHRKVLAIRHEIGLRSLQRYFLRPKIFA